MAKKYKVGDKVRVRKDLKAGKIYYMERSSININAVVDMCKLAGEIVTILTVGSKYTIKEDLYEWTDEMFEGLVSSNTTK